MRVLRLLVAMLSCLFGASLLFGCDSPASSPSSSAPNAINSSSKINVSRADYDTAKQKWQAQGITEYEVAVLHTSPGVESRDDRQAVFHVSEDHVTILRSFADLPGTVATPHALGSTDLQGVEDATIEGLFAQIAYALDYAEQQDPADTESHMVYDVQFDPALGYPKYIEWYCQEYSTPRPGELIHNCPTGVHVRLHVDDLKILRQSAR